MKFKKLIEGFDWWNKEIKDTSTGKILYKNTKELLDVVKREFNAMSDEEIISIIGGKTSNLKKGGAYFVTSRGDIISVGEAISRDLYIHMDYFKAIISYIYYNLEGSENFPDFFDVYDIFRLRFDEMFQSLTYDRHWCRFNCGNTQTENRVYCVLPPVVPTFGQCEVLETFLIDGSTRKNDVGVYVITGEDLDDSDYHNYSFKEHSPEEIIKLIKRYYASGEFYESIKNFHRDTPRFPIVEGKLKGANIYVFTSAYSLWDWLKNQTEDIRILYDSNIDTYFACYAKDFVHSQMIEQADREGYYYKMDDFIDSIGTLQNYIEFGQNGGWIGEGEDEEYVYPYLYYIVFDPKEEWSIGDDAYDMAFNTSIGTFLTRDCDLAETNLYDKVKANMVENYIGSEFNGIVYHGSQNNNLKFKDNYPLYMTDDKELAQDFARGYVFGYDLSKDDVPTLYQVKLTLKNPYIIKNEDEYENLMDITNYNNVVPDMMKNGYDGFIYHDTDENFTYYTAFDPKNQVKIISKELVENFEQKIIFNKDSYTPIIIGGEEYSDNDRECEIYYGIIYDNKHIGNVAIDSNTIEGFEIYPEFEGQGLGRKTIKSLLEKHPEINFVESTPQVKQFWEKCGFKINYYNDDSGLYNMSLSESLNEKIVKIGSKWQVQSEKGRNMGTYDTKAEAEDRLRQVHYFKYRNK